MYFFYAVLTNFAFIISPLVFVYRILTGKEDPLRFLEKVCIYSKKRVRNKIWIHAVSIGELMSIIPIIKKLEKNKKINTTARPLQRRYNQLNSIGLTAIFIFVCNRFKKQIIANLKSKHPSIILFDLYKLCFYCKLKKNA